ASGRAAVRRRRQHQHRRRFARSRGLGGEPRARRQDMTDGLYARPKGAGPRAIVLLHGFGGSNMDWNDIQPDLARDGLALAYDLPGHGRSLHHPAAGSAAGMAKAILADLEGRGVGKAHVAGFSMGGAVAALMAMRAPDRVASL